MILYMAFYCMDFVPFFTQHRSVMLFIRNFTCFICCDVLRICVYCKEILISCNRNKLLLEKICSNMFKRLEYLYITKSAGNLGVVNYAFNFRKTEINIV